jgi:transcription antitermination factor NusG
MGVMHFPWFVVAVRVNFERAVSLSFQEKGYDVFLPLYRTRRKWSDRSKQIDVPLFTGYTFCRFDPARRLPILQTPGVITIVGSKTTGPIPVNDGEIEAVQALVNSNLPVGPWPFLREGSMVRVEDGPLSGLEGIVITMKANWRLIVSVSLLQRSVYAEIDRDWVVPRQSATVPPASGKVITAGAGRLAGD